MTKIRLILLFALFSCNALIAQEGRKVNMGLSISPAFGGYMVDNAHYQSQGTKVGLSYGLLSDFRLFETDNYRLATGLTFTAVNGKVSFPDIATLNDSNYAAINEATISTSYVNIPFAIRLITSEIGYMKYYGLFGGEAGYLTKAKADQELVTDNQTLFIEGGDIKEDFNMFRLAMVVGIGVERYLSGTTRIMAGLHYSSGLTNTYSGKTFLVDDAGKIIFDENNQPQEDRDIRSRNNYLMVNFAVFF